MKATEEEVVALCTNNDEFAAAESLGSPCAAHTVMITQSQTEKSCFKRREEDTFASFPLDSVLSCEPGSHCTLNTLSEIRNEELSAVRFEGNSAGSLSYSSKKIRMFEEKDAKTITAWVPTMFTKAAGRPICVLEEHKIQTDSPYGLFMFSNSSSGSRTRENLLLNDQKSIPLNGSDQCEVKLSQRGDRALPIIGHTQDPANCMLRPPWRFKARSVAMSYENFYVRSSKGSDYNDP